MSRWYDRLGTKVPMRDGTNLVADVLMPENAGEKLPTILLRAGYSRYLPVYLKHAKEFVAAGYVMVLQDVRGRNDSEGVWEPFQHEGEDGYDTIEWIAAQPWSNGKVGMHGSSHDAFTQWAAARMHPPHLTTIASNSPATLQQEEWPFHNGVLRYSVSLTWLNLVGGRINQQAPVDWERVMKHRPQLTMDEALGRDMPLWREWLQHPGLDEYWQKVRLSDADFASLDIPVLHVVGMTDGSNFAGIRMYEYMMQHSPARDRQQLVFGPWGHNCHWLPFTKFADMDYGDASAQSTADIEIPWFDRWLKDDESVPVPKVRHYLWGLNEWRTGDTWPAVGNDVTFYLDSGGAANTLEGDGVLTATAPTTEVRDTYRFDPEDPTGYPASILSSPVPPESVDSRQIENRPDILCYTSEPVTKPTDLCGRPTITFFAASDCRDTDWFVQVDDVYPDGFTLALGPPGVLRARFRESLSQEKLLEPGEVYEYRMDLANLSYQLQPGHRLRVAIMSGFFPVYGPNSNTGNNIADDTEFAVATNTVVHGPDFPSRVSVPAASWE